MSKVKLASRMLFCGGRKSGLTATPPPAGRIIIAPAQPYTARGYSGEIAMYATRRIYREGGQHE